MSQLDQQTANELKQQVQQLQATLQKAGGTPPGAQPAFGDGTLIRLLIQYGPQILAIILEILDRTQTKPMP